jgi:hypothetical protein
MCQPNCFHILDCELDGTGYECDLTNDSDDALCNTCLSFRSNSGSTRTTTETCSPLIPFSGDWSLFGDQSISYGETPMDNIHGIVNINDSDVRGGFVVFTDAELDLILANKCKEIGCEPESCTLIL